MSPRFFVNLGAEESFDSDEPPTFSAAAQQAQAPLVTAWQAAFGDAHHAAAFPFLEGIHGMVPWLATPAAERAAARERLPLWGAGADVVRAVHDKAFAVGCAEDQGCPIAGLAVVLDAKEVDADAIEEAVSTWPEAARARFTVKPRLGTSGRGRVAGVAGRLDEVSRPALRALRSRGGCVVEPWLERKSDLSSQWWVHEGAVHLVGVTEQVTRRAGTWQGARFVRGENGAYRSGSRFDDDAIAAARPVVAAAAKRGFRGVCGVDAFTWLDVRGTERLRGVVEFNARFTGGFVALAAAVAHGVPAGARCEVLATDAFVVRVLASR